MRITFSGFDTPVDLADRGVTILQIKNEALFARVCESLLSMKGEKALEPYSVWDADGCEIASSNAFITITNPFSLPWKHKSLMGELYSRLEKEFLFDEDLRQEIQELASKLESSIHSLEFQLNANYAFGVEWNLSNYLKTFSYGIEVSDSASLLDKLIDFVDFGADMVIDKVIIFMNLKTFLTKNDLLKFQERVFFHGIQVLLLESYDSPFYRDCERKYTVDQDFVEYVFTGESECLSSPQGRICSNGFGAVTF